MISIQYLNRFSQLISFEQAKASSEFIRQEFVNNKLKLEEMYREANVVEATYFLDDSEDLQDVRNRYPNISVLFYKNEFRQGNYSKYDVELINRNGDVSGRSIEVIDHVSGDVIYLKSFRIDTNDVHYLEKSYKDKVKNIAYEFEYSEDGNFKRLTILDPMRLVDTDEHTFGPNDIGFGKNPYNFLWDGFEYYQFAEPVIPKEF